MIRTVCKPASGSLGTLTYYPSDESVLGALEGGKRVPWPVHGPEAPVPTRPVLPVVSLAGSW